MGINCNAMWFRSYQITLNVLQLAIKFIELGFGKISDTSRVLCWKNKHKFECINPFQDYFKL